MRTPVKKRVFYTIAALGLLSLTVGCQIPGASFASDPLQLRFAEATRLSLLAAEQAEQSELRPAARPVQSAQAEPIVLAGHLDTERFRSEPRP